MEVEIITQSSELPQLFNDDFFHSRELFWIVEHTPRMFPCMAIARNKKGEIHGQILAIIQRQPTFIPFRTSNHARIYGEGTYDKTISFKEKNTIFAALLDSLVEHLREHDCHHMEISHISRKMFGYKVLRRHGFFPVPWLQIHHSLHSKRPEERANEKALYRIGRAYKTGIMTREADNDEEITILYKLIKSYYRFRKQRHIPDEKLFHLIGNSINGHIYVTTYKDKIIGGSVVVDSDKNAMIWYDTALKKRYLLHYPYHATIWHAIRTAYRQGKEHIQILNVGLPFKRSRYRNFILSFGGKPVSSYRWFHFSFSWINKLLFWYYRI
ncbi:MULTISPECIES: GNAT family N-acetyltransferase [Prevotella]|uniref:GNAT family N-acetyltransferase n=1 Tax=Prevotella TaxID=838 RepID=UPI00102FC6D2|nr:GNAT family N-acetyltransferase [Prevotella brunnea]MDR0186610.1 GNAT family N-acetyltransferase [Prevotella brunnea]